MVRYLTAIIAALVMASCTYGYEGDGKTVVTEGTFGSFEKQKKQAQEHCAVYGKKAVLEGPRYDKFSHANQWSCE